MPPIRLNTSPPITDRSCISKFQVNINSTRVQTNGGLATPSHLAAPRGCLASGGADSRRFSLPPQSVRGTDATASTGAKTPSIFGARRATGTIGEC